VSRCAITLVASATGCGGRTFASLALTAPADELGSCSVRLPDGSGLLRARRVPDVTQIPGRHLGHTAELPRDLAVIWEACM